MPALSRALPHALPASAALLLLVSAWQQPARHPWVLAALLACAVAGALYRPQGSQGLGLGALALPLVAALDGPAATGALAGLASFVAGHWGWRGRRGDRRMLTADLSLAAVPAVAALGAGWVWRLSGAGAAALAPTAAGAVYLGLLAALDALRRRLAGEARWRGLRATLAALAVEGLAWAAGALLLVAWRQAGPTVALPLLAMLALLAAEAARQRHLRQQAERGRRALEQLGHAGSRMAGSAAEGSGELAVHVHRECRAVVPFSWLDFTLLGGEGASWNAGPDGVVRPGPADPPTHPPPLPGIHRRAGWQQVERTLAGGGAPLAQLTLWCDPRRLGAESLHLLDQLMPQLSGSVHRALLDRQARQDPLTGAALRRVLDAQLAEALARCQELGGTLAVVLADLDFFKRINDRHGHAAGDRALVAVAEVLRGGLRDGDLCARYGGEEFTLLLEGLDGAAALAVAERLRDQVEALRVEADGAAIPLTLSAGVAAFPEIPCRTPAELLALADAALYEAKRLGRNCCLLYRGRGRYRDGKGRSIDTGESPAPAAPTLFA
ncbi:MAG TPA: GGDEF domain-containing protein [Thermoanaerobaculia bacterium]|nr:GGDEF domain-containing protein [Thermoanaerobaculia bacterium]